MTTLNSRDVFKHLREMADVHIEHVVLEVTSHALDQNRLAGVRFSGGIILNLSREHLDYHGDMKSYAKVKGLLANHIKNKAPLVINKDNKWTKNIISKARATKLGLNLIWFTREQVEKVTTNLMGDWNKENVLAARLLAQEIGINSEHITAGVADVSSIPGRMEWIELPPSGDKENRNHPPIPNTKYEIPRVLIDYAVTPDALERVYKEVRRLTTGKLFAVLGACGNRDRGKRPAMARVVAKYADELVLTREDPWTESEEQIFKDLEQGLSGASIECKRVIDRRDAIKYFLEKADPNDVIVVTGKGAEVSMAIGKQVISWSDKEVIQEELEKIAKKINSI